MCRLSRKLRHGGALASRAAEPVWPARGQRWRRLISSPRWRSVRPPSVLECAIAQWARIRPALTEPIFGTARRRSRTRAVRSQAGESARIGASSIVPEASSFLSVALALRTSFACSSPRRRCSLVLAGTRAPPPPATTRAILEQRQAAVKRAPQSDQNSSPSTRLPRWGVPRCDDMPTSPGRRSLMRRSPK